MKPVGDDTMMELEETAREGAKQIRKFFTYQGDNAMFEKKARAAAAGGAAAMGETEEGGVMDPLDRLVETSGLRDACRRLGVSDEGYPILAAFVKAVGRASFQAGWDAYADACTGVMCYGARGTAEDALRALPEPSAPWWDAVSVERARCDRCGDLDRGPAGVSRHAVDGRGTR